MQQRIQPCLWFDHQAEESAQFYTSLFKSGRIGRISRFGEAGAKAPGQAEGSVMTVEFELEGQSFLGLNGGPYFKFTPAISFFVRCQSDEEIVYLWQELSKEGKVLMELQAYPWLKSMAGVKIGSECFAGGASHLGGSFECRGPQSDRKGDSGHAFDEETGDR